jgi:photosystem II stability/assembly factor-like uncharacterized protein
MRNITVRTMAAAAAGLAVVAVLPAYSAAEHVRRAFEMNLSRNGDWHAGEPGVAVNPRNPDNVVVVWPEQDATGLYRNPATGTFDTVTGMAVGYATDPAFSRCGLAVSFDGGRSWRRSVLPAQTAQSTLCSDATIAAGADGTFYAAVITFHQPTTPIPGLTPGTTPHATPFDPDQGSADVVIRSTDGGRTWSYPPVDAIGNRTAADRARYAPGSNPETGGEGTCDRPWITVDPKTDTVYVSGTADAIQFNGSTHNETWVSASHDHARTFGTVYPVDDVRFPQTGGATIASGHGQLAVAYVGHPADTSINGVVFATSRDDGRTFSRHAFAAPTQPSAPFGVYLAGDPNRAGRYAVAVPANGAVLVYLTSDDGRHWARPVRVAVGADRPWIAFGPDGTLGVVGRSKSSTGAQNVRVAFSFDGGRRFGRPVTVNENPAPALRPGTLSLFDDLSWLTLTANAAYVGWGDTRAGRANPNGENNVWIARLDIGR